jgi:hypothetical protein
VEGMMSSYYNGLNFEVAFSGMRDTEMGRSMIPIYTLPTPLISISTGRQVEYVDEIS